MIKEDRQRESNGAASDLETFVYGGMVVSIVWILSFICKRFDGVWESHATSSRQWLAVGATFIPYAAAIVFRAPLYRVLHERIFQPLARFCNASRLRIVAFAVEPKQQLARTILALCLALSIPFSITFIVPSKINSLLQWLAICFIAIWYRRSGMPVKDAVGRAGRLLATLRKGGTRILRSLPSQVRANPWMVVRKCFAAVLGSAFFGAAIWLTLDAHLRLAAIIGVVQGSVLIRLPTAKMKSISWCASVVGASIAAWVLSAPLPFASLAHFLLGATGSTALSVLAFCVAFALVLTELGNSQNASRLGSHRNRYIFAIAALACFVELGMRTDHLLSDWVPYHRNFWVAPADAIRSGGWLMWDVASQYGFLSVLSLAIWPATSTWQALYEQTAITLVFDAIVLFALLRYKRSGAVNAAFALVVSVATIYGSQGARVPFGWRLYPQVGLRFTGFVALVAIMCLTVIWRDRAKYVRVAYAAGYIVWAVSLLWSFESGAIATLVWLPFVVCTSIVKLAESAHRRMQDVRLVLFALAPFIVIAFAIIAGLQLYYLVALGHGPDWQGYFEFTAAYQQAEITVPVPSIHGPGWVLIAFIVAVGAVALRAIRNNQFESVPAIVACWFGLWGVGNYYISEAFHNHVNSLVPIFAVILGALLALQRAVGNEELLSTPTLAFFAPTLVIVLAQTFGSPTEIAAIEAPGSVGYSFDSAAHFAPVGGELANLLTAAKVSPYDPVLYPISIYSVKIDNGLIMPFRPSSSGDLLQQPAWLPLSPIGAFNALLSLPYERRTLYLERYIKRTKRAGWMFSYHEAANCGRLLPGLLTTRVHRSANYELALCVVPSSELSLQASNSTDDRE